MPLILNPVSLNAYCEAPTERLSGSNLAELILMVEVSHGEKAALKLMHDEITLALKNPIGRLIYVDQPHQINGKWELKIPADQSSTLRLAFHVPDQILQQFSQLAWLTLDIQGSQIQIEARDLSGLLPILPPAPVPYRLEP